MSDSVEFLRAGAGTGKTYSLVKRLVEAVKSGQVMPNQVLLTTFTRKAAEELVERLHIALLENSMAEEAQLVSQSRIGTVHSVCQSYLEDFCFEAGLSPGLRILDDTQAGILMTKSVASAVDEELLERLETLAGRFSIDNWSSHVANLIHTSRTNGLNREDLKSSLHASLGLWAQLLPTQASPVPAARLLDSANTSLRQLREIANTSVSRNYCEDLERFKNGLNHGNFAWKDWVKARLNGPAKADFHCVEELKELIGNVDEIPAFQEDISLYSKGIYQAADDAWEHYESVKEELGLVDYSDQERKFLDLLENPGVCERIQESLRLFMVDEFQDTNPIQLAIFSKLQDLAETTVYVGDSKQAIYSFRGSDPQLVNSFAQYQVERGAKVKDLGISYRSTPDLVNLANTVFPHVFQEQKGVRYQPLNANRKDQSPIPGFQVWFLKGKNWDIRLEALAAKIEEMVVQDGEINYDYKDIAVLCRTGDRVKAVSDALAARAIPYRAARAGFTSTPETCLVKAALKWLMNPADQLARMEIITLAFSQGAAGWIPERIKEKTDQNFQPGFASKLEPLAGLRGELNSLTLSELMRRIYDVLGVYEAAISWHKLPPGQLQARLYLEHILSLAHQYEENCISFHNASNIPGFLFWLDELSADEKDEFPVDDGDGGVNIMTWHKSKGLEWPVVILLDLEDKVKERSFSLNVTLGDVFDPSEPLRNRQPTLLFRPFGKVSKGIELYERAKLTGYGKEQDRLAHEEAARVLYVTMTRARDVLVLANSKQSKAYDNEPGTPWGMGGFFQAVRAPTEPGGQNIKVHVTELEKQADTSSEKAPVPGSWVEPLSKESKTLEPLFLTPSKLEETIAVSRGESLSLPSKLQISDREERVERGENLHSVLAYILQQDLEKIEELQGPFGLEQDLWQKTTAYCSSAIPFIIKHFSAHKSSCEIPARFQNEKGQWYRGWIDWTLETESGLVIIDHKFSGRSDAGSPGFIKAYAPQLAAYKKAMEAADQAVCGTWLHLPLQGKLIQVEV